MLKLRKSEERGFANHGWLKSRHTFSFADYHDAQHMGFRQLRVINEDRIEGGTGFGKHPHRDMEIISYVVSGALEHEDSAGNKTIIQPGEVQRMSAGTGIAHSEFNHLKDQEAHFFQIWIVPDQRGVPYSYGQKSFVDRLDQEKLVLTISKTGRDGSIAINQDVDLYISRLKERENIEVQVSPGRAAWIHVVKGAGTINGNPVRAGDAVSTEDESRLKIEAKAASEFLIFDLA